MRRSRILFATAAALYAIAWFLPVVKGGTTLAKGGLPGWEALRTSLSPAWDANSRDSWWQACLSVLSGLTNFVFVGAMITARRSTRYARELQWLGVGAFLINLHWFVIWHPRSELRPGYYAWVASFALLAALLFARQRGEKV